MRTIVLASTVLAATVLSAGAALAEPTIEELDLKAAIELLRKAPKPKKDAIAAARFANEVFGLKKLRVVAMSAAPDNAAISATQSATRIIASRKCKAKSAAELTAAEALLLAYPLELTDPLRAYTLGSQGKGADAAELFASWAASRALPGMGCLDERWYAASAREEDLRVAIRCIEVFDPKRSTLKLTAARTHAEFCAKKNFTGAE